MGKQLTSELASSYERIMLLLYGVVLSIKNYELAYDPEIPSLGV